MKNNETKCKDVLRWQCVLRCYFVPSKTFSRNKTPRQTHLVQIKTFSRNKTHPQAHSVPSKTFSRNQTSVPSISYTLSEQMRSRYLKSSEWEPNLTNLIWFSVSSSQISNVSLSIWHSMNPRYSPISICGLYSFGTTPFSLSFESTSFNCAICFGLF